MPSLDSQYQRLIGWLIAFVILGNLLRELTEQIVPVLPWIVGVLLIGVAVRFWLLRQRRW